MIVGSGRPAENSMVEEKIWLLAQRTSRMN